MATYYSDLKKLSDKDGEVSFQAEIPLAILEKHMGDAVIREAADFALPGFRKGKVPESIVRQHISEMDLLEDAAHTGFQDAIREIITDEKLSIVGAPQAAITKIALKSPVTFTVKFALYPAFTLPDYKKIGHDIAERKEKNEVSEQDIDEAIQRIQRMMAPKDEKAPAEEAPLPPITDEFLKQFGSFKNVEEFRAEIKKQLAQEKEVQAEEVKREEIVKKIMDSSKIKIPALLIDEEYYDFIERRDDELARSEMSLEEYLKAVKKTEKELEQEERKLIEDRIKMSLVLGEIRKKEDIKADEEEIHKYIPSLKMRYPERSETDMHQTAEAYLIQEKLFEILEGKVKEEKSVAEEKAD
jgi:FKBP-type peptidyl-prolyl cis-trans isomerase (trigger factor)